MGIRVFEPVRVLPPTRKPDAPEPSLRKVKLEHELLSETIP
jgi:hypothetical protein